MVLVLLSAQVYPAVRPEKTLTPHAKTVGTFACLEAISTECMTSTAASLSLFYAASSGLIIEGMDYIYAAARADEDGIDASSRDADVLALQAGQTAKPGRLQARANSAMLLYMRLMQVQLLLRLQGPKESIHHLWRDLQ